MRALLIATALLALGACVRTGSPAADVIIGTVPSLLIWGL